MKIAEIIAKRKALWEKHHDLKLDKEFTEAVASEIVSSKSLLAEIEEKPYLLIEAVFHIVDKHRKTVPFFFNFVQRDFISKLEEFGTKKPYFILKGRQQGFTSLITAIQLSFAITRKNFSGFTIADRNDNTRAIFNDKARVVYDRLPQVLKPTEKFNSMNEMFFSKLNSSWRIATATGDVGRSRTLNFVHFSEVAFFECNLSDIQAGIGEALVDDALIIYETTANGFNQAKDLWDSKSCVNLFYSWWDTPEYVCDEKVAIEGDSWIVSRIKLLQKFAISERQIAWYFKKYKSYLDKEKIKQEYPISASEAFVSSGRSIFDMEKLSEQMMRVEKLKCKRRGYFTYKKSIVMVTDNLGNATEVEYKIHDIEFVDDENGYITLHELPEKKTDSYGNVLEVAPYVLGADTAGSGEDFFSAKVISNLSGKTVATLHLQNIDEDLFALQIYCLGKFYNDAFVGIEINYSRLPTRLLQTKYRYPNLYVREKIDTAGDKPILEFGFETTSKTKPIIISELVEFMRESPESEVDLDTLKEMTTFVRKDGGRCEAISGCHDDLVMALAIAHFISKNFTHSWIKKNSCEDFIARNFNLNENNPTENIVDWG